MIAINANSLKIQKRILFLEFHGSDKWVPLRKETGEFLLSLFSGINTMKNFVNMKQKQIVLEETIKSTTKPKRELTRYADTNF